jgi:hypothetical protein
MAKWSDGDAALFYGEGTTAFRPELDPAAS